VNSSFIAAEVGDAEAGFSGWDGGGRDVSEGYRDAICLLSGIIPGSGGLLRRVTLRQDTGDFFWLRWMGLRCWGSWTGLADLWYVW
jgi:hypothetical protein